MMPVMTIAELPVQIDRDKIAAFCRAHGIRRLSLFGSVLRDDFDSDRSDVDVLAEFMSRHDPKVTKNLFPEDEIKQSQFRASTKQSAHFGEVDCFGAIAELLRISIIDDIAPSEWGRFVVESVKTFLEGCIVGSARFYFKGSKFPA